MNEGGQRGVRMVRLENVPVGSLVAIDRHVDDLLHEFRIIGSGMASGVLDADVPRRLASLIEEFCERFASERLTSRQLLDEAAARGDETVTIELPLPADAAPALQQYGDLLDQADEYCRKGALLTLAPPPELVELRRRLFDEVVRQLGGEPRAGSGEGQGEVAQRDG